MQRCEYLLHIACLCLRRRLHTLIHENLYVHCTTQEHKLIPIYIYKEWSIYRRWRWQCWRGRHRGWPGEFSPHLADLPRLLPSQSRPGPQLSVSGRSGPSDYWAPVSWPGSTGARTGPGPAQTSLLLHPTPQSQIMIALYSVEFTI